MPDYDDAGTAADYEAARALPLDAMEGWREALTAWLPPPSGLPVLDVGAGTGVFATAFAGWFDCPVVGIEPAAGMRGEAASRRRLPGVAYAGGDGCALPLRDRSCGAAWLSTVIHHLPDLGQAASELRRVVVPGGPVLIRSAFPGRTDGISLFRLFPGAADVVAGFPSVDDTAAAFGAAGFELASLEPVPQVSAPSLRAWVDGARRRADTVLLGLTDEHFAAGMAAAEAVAAASPPGPVVDHLDLLVLV